MSNRGRETGCATEHDCDGERPRHSFLPASRINTRASESNRAGALKSRAQDEHATDHDRRAVAEDGERFICAQDTRDEQHSHCAQCYQVSRRPLAQESSEDRRHKREDYYEMKSVHAYGSVADFTPALFSPTMPPITIAKIGRTARREEHAQAWAAFQTLLRTAAAH